MKKLYIFIVLTIQMNLFAQWSCSSAIALTSGFSSSSFITSPGTSTTSTESWISTASTDGNTSSTGFTHPDVYTFKYTTGAVAGESFYFTIECNYATDGEHSIGVWRGCSGSTVSNCVVSTYKFKNVVGVCAQNLLANTTYYIGVGKEWASSASTSSGIASRKLKFKVIDFTVETSTTIPSDECNTAAAINIADPYAGSTRCNYSASTGSPSVCGMAIENDSWMKFTAGSTTAEIDYEVYNCTNGYGVQLNIFSGSCGSLSLITGSCVNYASNDAGGTWTLSGLTVGQTYYIRTDGYAGDLCSYSFQPVSGVVILPIELINFQASALQSGYNKITWSTASENNVNYFVLEKSLDGKNFKEVSRYLSDGNSTTLKNYYELDESNTSETVYYRIKTVDLNGQISYSSLTSVKNVFSNELSFYPNPTIDGMINIQGIKNNENTKIEVYNNQGTLMLSFLVNEQKTIDLTQQEKGIYFVKIINEEIQTVKIINQ